jgi:DNA-binding MurR/RpiR family transcriptional regulator
MSVTATLQDRLKGMRPSEAEVARRLLRNLGLIAGKSLREVAAQCRTSDATVVRACRAAGFDGFQDLKYHVLREFTSGEPPPPSARHGAYGDDIGASLASAEASLDRAAGLLRQASRVVLAGVGASYGVALIATDILFTLGRQALPAISHSGETRFPVRVAQDARQAGVPSIGLSNEPGSELAQAVDVLVPTQAVEPPRGSYAIAPRLCQLAVLDRLFSRTGRATSAGRTR